MTAAIAGVSPFLHACDNKPRSRGKIVGASSKFGHLLRDQKFAKSMAPPVQHDVVIVGGGISGLSAARWLHKNGITNFILLDLEPQMGGNAAFGQNTISPYPWGAHYITIPNNNLQEYVDFLVECNVITGYNEQALPMINDYYLCQDPQERLYINGQWQDGLLPQFGVPQKDRDEIHRFMQMMDMYRKATGTDGRDAFAIPVDHSSKEGQFTILDTITMKDWMLQQNFTSEYLRWYVNYCTRDDFGTAFDVISAWVGIHYFAGRKGRAGNAESHDVITWPEGNGWLSEQLQAPVKEHLKTNAMAVSVVAGAENVLVEYLDTTTQQLHSISAKQCILATPQFVNNRLLQATMTERAALVKEKLHYAPWMVANLSVKNLKERSGMPLSWDNVLYNSPSLGYVKANQQQVNQDNGQHNLTYYLPLTDETPASARKHIHLLTHSDWVARVFKELEAVHPNIDAATQSIDIMLWGHAMPQPLPNLVHGNTRQQLQQSVGSNIHFAHSDLAGISIFEEAFYQGIAAAKKVMGQIL
ncbi:MAG: FAD-dependent oxidoreductase [Bacteroidota bacterium]